MASRKTKPLSERFKEKISELPSGCWAWQGSLNGSARYGVIYVGNENGRKKHEKAHRVAFTLFRGAIPDGCVIDHLCRNRACVNPAHLEAVSNRENILRGQGITARRLASSLCPNGHPKEGNTRIDKAGRRFCGACRKARGLRDRQSRKRKSRVPGPDAA